jgi:hypothetical protein
LAQQGVQFKELCKDQKLIQADYRRIAESCLDTDKYKVCQTLHSVANTTFVCYSLELSSSPATAVHQYQPGGVIAITQDTTVGRIKEKGQDKWADGRSQNSWVEQRKSSQSSVCTKYATITAPVPLPTINNKAP